MAFEFNRVRLPNGYRQAVGEMRCDYCQHWYYEAPTGGYTCLNQYCSRPRNSVWENYAGGFGRTHFE